jgi:hypothetical protein
MNNGTMEEFDHPFKLLAKNDDDEEITNKEGFFAKMLFASGDETANSLFKIA